ncbi:MAG: cell division ATP-binding protein FtsE [Candidatus Cryptobacteroides sp.]
MEERTPVISFRDADILNGEQAVIYDLDLDVYPGDFVYIVGKVGTGKTSIIRTIIAENPLLKGEGKVCGYDLRTIRDKEIPFLRRKMGVVFQDFQLLMDRSVEENLEFVLRATGWKVRDDIEKRIREVLDAVGLAHKAHKMPHQLSGGEQQRIAIARALLNSPQVILADEPTGNLDPETADGIMQLIRRINEEKGTAVVMVTHNLSICGKYRGRIMVCSDEGCREQETEWRRAGREEAVEEEIADGTKEE